MNELLTLGVAGFRIDAAKHMWPHDLFEIFSRVNNLSTKAFPANSRPFIYQEVIDLGGGAIKKCVNDSYINKNKRHIIIFYWNVISDLCTIISHNKISHAIFIISISVYFTILLGFFCRQ